MPFREDGSFVLAGPPYGGPERGTLQDIAAALAQLKRGSPFLAVTNIASFNAARNRFEDSSGNEVTVPDLSMVFLEEDVYQAAAADSGFTPNPRAFFWTR